MTVAWNDAVTEGDIRGHVQSASGNGTDGDDVAGAARRTFREGGTDGMKSARTASRRGDE